MVVPHSLLVIKPMSVGRGDAPAILQSILDDCPVTLRKFRTWSICDTTLFGMTRDKGLFVSNLDYDAEQVHCAKHIDSWICVFTHIDRVTDPTELLNEYCGPIERTEWVDPHLRHAYGGYRKMGPSAHASDTVVHIALPERVVYEAEFLFLGFNPDSL